MTGADSALELLRIGVRIERTDPDAGWGHGFYTATRPDPRYGEVSVRVAVRLLHPFIAHDPIAAQEQIDRLLRRAGSEDIRAVLLAEGYDGAMVHWGPGDTWVVAYHDEQVRIVQGQADA